ncbi:EAL domain-containing protein [Allosphingosinicella sp.]|jgi:EAL domain-containing protein (putative c-di-GMP-specific phosphodiesterase class I)|uniref:EAL domain-containing protein n=1 Tax=Allosphingosinicella sp. TaxID=2823234 RepID=UPI002EE495E4
MRSASDLELAEPLRLALASGALTLDYQPKIHVSSRQVSGVEALARWDDPELGAIPPETFVPVAERFGLIDELSDWALRTALSQWAQWRDQGVRIPVAVNVSALNLRDQYLPDHIQRLCMRSGMPCEFLTIEVTEGATLNVVHLLDTLTRFRLKGLRVSLDDFGTGYSSLVQLRQLPYSEIKIDQCFVADAATSTESRMIVKAVIDLAHGMGLTAIAEGVEDARTLELLGELGCDEAQGFFVARPMAPAGFVDWLIRSGRGWPDMAVDQADEGPEPVEIPGPHRVRGLRRAMR